MSAVRRALSVQDHRVSGLTRRYSVHRAVPNEQPAVLDGTVGGEKQPPSAIARRVTSRC
jgi:hypothetical protein